MEYITNGLRNLCFGNSIVENQGTYILTLKVKFNDQTFEYKGNTNEQTTKLYYNMLSQIDKIQNYNDFKTEIKLEGNDKQTYQITTFKKLF